MSSRRTSNSEEAHQPPGARARTGSASSARSGGSGSKVVTSPVAPTTSSPLAPNVSCHYRYNGCYLLVIISDGCDMLRQEQLCQALKLNAARSDGTPSEPPADLASQLDALDAEWNRKFTEHTTQRIAKGLLSWNSTQTKCDLKPLEAFLENSLMHLTQPSSNGQESENSEMILQYAQDSLAVEVLLNPTLFTLTQCLRNVLHSPTGAVHVIYAGASFEETGSWILQDGSFSAYNFYELVQTEEKMASHSRPSTATTLSVAQGDTCKGHSSIAEHLSAHDIVLHFHSERSGEWAALSNIFSSHQFEPISNSMTSSLIMAELNGSGSSGGGKMRRESPTKRRRHLFHFDLNPADSPDGVQGAAALIDYLGEKLGKYYSSRGTVSQARFGTSADSALVDSVGYIRLDRPTLYVFPGGQGDCALFGLDNGFTMLIDGGFLPGQKSYWNFIRHLQRLDSVVVTHLGEDNIFGLKSLLENKLMREKWQSFKAPQIGYLFCNDQFSQPTKEEPQSEFKSLLDVATLSLTGLNGQFFNSLNQLQIEPLACIRNIDSINCTSLPTTGPASRPGKSDKPVPVTLYHKVGHGTLYMYTLNPTLEGITKPQAAANASDEPAATIPEADQQSICTLLIWRPHDLAEKIARILIPGNCTQSDILEGFESLLAMSRVSTRVSRYAPKPKNDGETSIEMAELDILLGHPYPCTGDNIEALLKSRQEEKAVKFRTTPGSLHGYRRSASVAPKVISTRQQQQQAKQSKQQMHPRNRSTTPSRFSRFRSVSPTLRIGQDKKKVDKGAIGASSTTSSVAVHSRQPRAAPPSRASSRARDETSTHSNTVNANVASRQLKSISRPPSSASSGDRAAHRPIASKGQTATGDNIGAKKTPPAPKAAPRTSSVSKRQPLPPISKAEAAPSAKTTAISAQSSGKVFKSPKEFRKSVEASKSVAAPLSAAPTKTTESGTNEARAVPRKVKRPEPVASVKTESKNEDQPKEEDKVLETIAPVTASVVGVAAAGAAVALAVTATEPELKTDESADAPTMPRNETFDKDLDKLTVENRDLMYEADSEDVSLRSATDEEVNKITQLIAEREKAEADGKAVGDIFPKSPSPPVDSQATEIEGIDADDVTSIRTVTPDIEESKDEVHLDTAADTEHDISIAIDDSSIAVDGEVKVEEAKPDIVQVAVKGVDGYETDYEQLDSLASVDLESEMKVVAPPPSTPFQPEVETDLAIGQANSNQLQKAVEIASVKINEEAVIKKKEAEVSAVEDKSIENKESTDAKEETAQMSATLVAETQQPKLDPPTQLTSSTSDQNLGLDVSNELEMSTSISNVDLMQPSMNDAHMGTATLATDDNKDNEPIVANSEDLENEILKESNDSLSKAESTESHEQPSIDDSIIRGEAEESSLDTSAKANQVSEKTTDKPTEEAIETESKAMETEVISLKMETTESAPTIDSIIVPSVNLDQTTESQIDTSEMEKSQTIAYDDLTEKKLDVESTSEASIESKPGNATGSNDLFNENLIEGVQTTLTQSPEPESDMACRKTESTTQLEEEISPPIADNNLPENTLEIDESTSEKAVESKIEATESALVSNAPTDLLHTTEAIQPPEPEFDKKTDTTEIDSKLETLQVIADNTLVESEKQLDIESTSEEPIKSKTDAVESASVSNMFTEVLPTTLIQPVESKTEIESDKLDNIKSDPIESAIELANDTAENGASEIQQPKQMEITVASKDQLEKENVVPSVLESKTEAEITTEPKSLEEELTAAAKNENVEQSTVSSELTKRQEMLEPSVLPSSTAENIVVSGEKQLEREVDTKVNVPITTETNVAVNSDSASFDKEDQIDAEIGTVDESIKSSPTVQSITTEAIKPEISSSKSDPIATESVSEIDETLTKTTISQKSLIDTETTKNASLTVDSPETEPQQEEQLVLEPNDDTKTITVDASVPAAVSSESASNAENVAKMSDNTVSETVPSELAKVADASKIALSENETDLDGKSIFVEKSTESTSDQPIGPVIDSNKSAFTEGHSLEVISTEPATQVKITEIPEDKPTGTVLPNDESRVSKPELVSQKMEETESAPTSTTVADSPVISLSQLAESTNEQFSENYNSGKEATSGELKAPAIEIEIETKKSTFTESVPISQTADLPATSLSDSKSELSSEQLLESTNIDFQLKKDEAQAIAASTLVEAETKPDIESTSEKFASETIPDTELTREEPSESKIGEHEIGSQKTEATESSPISDSESATEMLATSLSQAETEQPQHATNIDSQLENGKSQIILDNTGKESGLIENDYTRKKAISGEVNEPAIEMKTESEKSTLTESAPISTDSDLPATSLSQSSESTSKQPEKLTDIDSQLDTDELQSITDNNIEAKVEEKRQTTDEMSVESEIDATESVAVSKTPTELSQITLAETKPEFESTSEKFAPETKPDTESTREEPSETKIVEHEIGSQKTDATESAPISDSDNFTELLATSLSQAETESTTAQHQQATNIDSQLENDKSQIILDNTGKEAFSGELKESAIEKEIESKKSTLTESAPISTAVDLPSTSMSQSSESISKQPQSITDKVEEKRKTTDEMSVESKIEETESGVVSKTPTELLQTTLAHSIEPEIQQQAKPTETINDKEANSIFLKDETVETEMVSSKAETTETASISAATELLETSLGQAETESTAEQPQQPIANENVTSISDNKDEPVIKSAPELVQNEGALVKVVDNIAIENDKEAKQLSTPEIQQQAKPTEIINDKETGSILLKNESKVVEPQIMSQKIEATESAPISAATELLEYSLRQVETESAAEQPQQAENIDLQLEIDEAQALAVVEAENKSGIESRIEKPVESTIEETENVAVSKTFPEESQPTVSQSIKPEIDLTKQTGIEEKQVKSSENMEDKHVDLLATSLSQSETESTAEQPQQAKNIDSELQNGKSQIILDNNLLVSETKLDNETTREKPSESKIVSMECADLAHDSLAQSTEHGKPQQVESTEVIDAQISDKNLLNDDTSLVESEIVPQKVESTESAPVVSTVELPATSLSQSELQLTQQQSEIETKIENEKSQTIADSTLLDIKPKPDIDATNEKAVESKIEVTQIGATEFHSPDDLASQPTMTYTDKSENDQSGKDNKIDTQIEKEEMSDKQNTAETEPETLKQTMEIVSAENNLKNDVKGESSALSEITTESATISGTVLKSEGKEKELDVIQVDDSVTGKESQITEPTVELSDVKETEMTASTVVKVSSEKAQQAEEMIETDQTVDAQKTSENEVPIKSETEVIQDNEAIATVELTQIASSTAENIPEAEETVETCDVKRGDAQPTTAIQEEGDTEVPRKETDDAQVHTGDQAQKPTAPAVDDVKVDSVTAPLEEVNNLESDTHEMTNDKQLGPVEEKTAEIETSEDANTIEASSSTVTDLEFKEEPTEEITVSLQSAPVSDNVETEIKQKTETGDYFDKIAQKKTKVGETVEQEEPFVAELRPKITNEHVETLEAITPVALSEPDYFDRVMTEKNLSTQEVIESEKTSDEEKTTGESIAEFDVKAAHPTTEAVTLSLHEPIEDAIRDDNDKQTTLEKSSDELNESAIKMETESKKTTLTESAPISTAADLPSTSLSQSSESTSKQPEKLKDIASQLDKDELQSITDNNIEAKVEEKRQTTDEMSVESEIDATESVAVSKTPTELSQITLAETKPDIESTSEKFVPETKPDTESTREEPSESKIGELEIGSQKTEATESAPISTAVDLPSTSLSPSSESISKQPQSITDKVEEKPQTTDEMSVESEIEATESAAVSKTPTELLQTTLAHSIEPEIHQEAKPTETFNDKEANSIFLKDKTVETEMVSSKTETTETASISAATELLETSLGQAETESTAEQPQQPIANENVTSISDNKDEPVIKSAPELVRDEGALDKVVNNIAIENDKEAKHLSTTEKVIAPTLDDETQSNLEQSSGQIADQATKQEAPEKDDSKPEKQIDSELTANVSNVDSETKSPSASSGSELIPEEAANSIESVPCEIVETPESSPEQTLPDSPSDGLDRKLRSPFEIIDELDPDGALYSKPQLGESPIILSPASPSTETLPEHSDRLEITEITSPPESRRQTYRRSDSEFDRKFLQLGLGDRDRLTDSSIKEVTSSSEAISKPSLAKRSDSQFDAAFMQSKDITGEPEVDEPASEASLDNYASSKLENYFTSELVTPLETKVNEMNFDDVATGFEIVNTSGQVMDENENLLQELQAEGKAMLKEAILEEVSSLKIVEDIEIANLEPIVTEIRQLQVEEPVRESVPQIEEGLLTKASHLVASQSEDLSLASETTLTSLSSQLASSIDKADSTLESLVRDSASVPSLDTDPKSLNASLTEVVSVSDFLLKESMNPPEDEGFQSKHESITLDSFDSTFSQDTIIERHLSVTEDSSLPSSTEESIVQSKPEKKPSDSMLTDSKKTDNTSQLEMASIEKDTDIVSKESQTKEDKSFDNLTESQTIFADNPDNAQSEQAAELFVKPKSPSELPSLPVKSDESKQSIDSITVKEIVTESEPKLITTTEISNGNSVIIENVQPNEMGFSVSSTEQTNSQTLKQPDNTSEELIEIVEVPETTSKRTTEVETLPIKEPTSRSETQPKSEPIGQSADEGEAKETPNLEIKTSLTQDILPQSEIANSVAQVSDSSAVPNQAGESLIVSIGNETSISSQSISKSDKDGNIKLDLEADKKTDIKDSIEPSVSLIEDNFSLEGTAAAAADKLEKLQTDDMVLSVETNVEQVSDQINTQMDSFLITHPDSESAPISSVDKASSEESAEPKLKEEHDPLLAPSTVDLNKLLGIGDGESDEETTAAKSTEVVVDAKVDSLETVQLIQEDKLQEDTASSLGTSITRHSMSVEEATPLDISKSPYSSDAFEENEQSVLPDLQPKTVVNLSEDIKQDSTTTLASPELPSEVNIPSEVLSISVNQSMEPKDIKLDCDYEEENTSVTTSATESAQFEKKLDHNTLNEQTIPASDILQKSTETVTEQIKTGNLQTDNKPEKMTETEDTSTKNKDNEPENIQQTPTLKQAESVEASPIITPLDSKPSSSVLESTTSMITTTTTTSGPETSRVSESNSLPMALPEPYEIATAVIEMVNERVKELQQSEVSSSHLAQMATTLESTKTEGKRKDSKQDELNIIAQIKSQSIDLEDLRDNLIETSQTNLAAIPSTITKLDSNQTNKKISESTKMVESEINSKIETFKDSTILNNKAAPLSESLISTSQSSSFGGIEDYGVGHLETANYNSRFDTNVPVENIAYSTSYKQTHSGDAQLPGEMQINESIERSLSAEKYRVSDNEQDDIDMFQEHSSSIVEQVTKQYEFTPLTAEMVHLSESEPEIEVTLHEPEEFQYSSTILSSVSKPSEGSHLVSATSRPINDPTDISLQDFITQTANVVVQLSPGKENVEQLFQIGEPIKEQSVTDTVSLTSSKSSTFEGAPTETSTLPTGLISASTQEVTTADQIDRFTAKLTAFPEQHVTEMRTVLERDLVESKQLIEKSETQTMVSEVTANLEERVLQEGKSVPELLSSTLTITTFSATPTVQSTAVDSEPLSLPTSSVAALSESFSTSSSSYYKEPLMSSSLHRVTDVAYLSGHMDESSSSSTSSIETSSDEDDGNMFQFSPRTGTITRTTLSPTGPGSNLLTSTTSAHIGNGQTTTSTMSFVLNSNATSNGTAGNGSSQSNGAPASQPFDVDREWGRPLSLPTPQPPMTSNQNAAKLPPLPPQSRMRNRSIDRSGRTEPPSQRPTENGHAASLGPQSRIHPVYVELAYVPGHGKRGYCDEQYFRKVRARYYVFSGVTPSREVFDALLSAKATWEQNLYVTLIPTYESESLCSWIADNQTRLTELRIDVTPAANRCSINLADNGTPVTGNNETGTSEKGLTQESCAAYKVEL